MGNEKKTNTTKEHELAQLGNVDQIREILFGSQSRELKERFEHLEERLKLLHEEMRKKIEQTQNDFNTRIEREVETISRKIKNVITQQQDEFSDVRDSAIKQEKRILSALDNLEEELNAKREQLQRQHIENNTALRNEMDSLKDEVLKTLKAKMDEMNGIKLSREDAAEILMEAAMAMKGTQINQQIAITKE